MKDGRIPRCCICMYGCSFWVDFTEKEENKLSEHISLENVDKIYVSVE